MTKLISYQGMVSLVYQRNTQVSEPFKITHSEEAAAFFRSVCPEGSIEHVERMYAAYLNNTHEVIGVALISIGGLCSTLCVPK